MSSTEPRSITEEIQEIGERGRQMAEARGLGHPEPVALAGVEAKTIDPMMRILPLSYLGCRLGSPELVARMARPAVIDEARDCTDAGWVTFTGPSGSGKTSLAAACVRRRHADRRNRVTEIKWVHAVRLAFARLRYPLGENDPPEVTAAISVPLLVIDDLGQETPVQTSPIPEILFERHAQGRATWITTWLDPDSAAKKYGDGLARRIFERSKIVRCAP